MKIYEKISELLREKGLSQAGLERKLGFPTNRFTKWKNGQGYPDGRELLRIARTLGVTMEYLVDDDMDRPALPLSETDRMILVMAHKLGVERAIDRLIDVGSGGGAVVWDFDDSPGIEKRRGNQKGDVRSDPGRNPALKSR